jgi:hypothetical protein
MVLGFIDCHLLETLALGTRYVLSVTGVVTVPAS